MNMNRTTLLSTAAACALAFLALPREAGAAFILWDTPTTISADADVSTTGSLLYAFTFGTTGVPSATVNGVTFASFAATNSSTTVGSVTLAPALTLNLISSNTAYGSASSPFSNLTTAYKGLLQSGVTDGSSTGSMSLTLGGLTNGTSYQVEVWVNESALNINNPLFNSKTILTATNAVTLDDNSTNADGGVGQWVTGTFTASGTSQLISLTASASSFPDINAVQVRAVPEPSTTVALLGGLGLLAARRRRARTA